MRIYGIRAAHNPRHIRLFVAAPDGVNEVTARVASACGYRITKAGWISIPGTGYNPIQHVVDLYASKAELDNVTYEDMG